MARRKPAGWQYSGVVQGKKAGRREKKGWFGRSKPSRETVGEMRMLAVTKLPRGRAEESARRRGGIVHLALAFCAFVIKWAFSVVANKRWRPLAFSEALIWFAVAAVCIAFLLLMAKFSLLLAVGIFILMIAYAWRELGEK
ncbi:MAG: hypothetical protein Q7O66_11830 [Dehalococcoidia bacterium]|nr:hypothetical protein [Dehalococcoidia bacterium]